MDVTRLGATQRKVQPANRDLDRITERRGTHHLDIRAGNQAKFHQAALDARLGVDVRDATALARGKMVERPTSVRIARGSRVHAGDLILPISLTSESRKQVAPHMSQPPGSCSAQERGLAL